MTAMHEQTRQPVIHVCVGIYPNGTLVINHVRDQDLKSNIAYNRAARPGRAYFVDGQWACGGEHIRGFLDYCKARVADLTIPPSHTDSRPYQ